MKGRFRFRRIMPRLLVVAAMAAAGACAFAARSGPDCRVLVLYSYSRQLPWNALVGQGLDEYIASLHPSERPTLFEEYLDSVRVGEIGDPAPWAAYLAQKYGKVKLDLIVTESQQAAALLLAFPGLFPGTPRCLFHFVPSPTLPPGTGLERRYSSALDLETALRTIRQIPPGASRIVAVTDRSSLGLARSAQLVEIAKKDAGSYALEIWDDFTEGELREKAGALPKDAAILYLPVQRDREGKALLPAVVAADLARAASVPVFSHFDSLLGTGIVGGYMVSGRLLGRLMGEAAARGEAALPPSQAAYAAATMGYYFDDRALRRWNIRDASLPRGASILFREPGFLERYWKLLAALSLVFGLETLLVLALARVSLQRKRALALLAEERAALEGKVLARTADLAAAAAEKETLHKELQHRVKNSLGIIASLVALEAGKSGAPEARETLSKLESRIAALASLYDVLFESGGAGRIGLADYLGRVVDSATESLGADARGIAVDRAIEGIPMDMKRAVSLGLIANELVTDSLKYAFPGGRPGRVSVRLARWGEGLLFEVSDDGAGFPPGFDLSRSEGFGLHLVALLARQLGGEFSAEGGAGGGVRFALRLPA
jgi:two-component sensor histidine kinase